MSRVEREPLLSLKVRNESDIVVARQHARQLGRVLGLNAPDQVGLATAVSEIVRNAVLYGGEAQVDFELDLSSRPQYFGVRVTDKGPGIQDLQSVLGSGLSGARRLTDRFEIASAPNQGTVVTFGKMLPGLAKQFSKGDLARLTRQFAHQGAPEPADALREHDRDLIQTLDTLRARDIELEGRRLELERLNLELEETNRGVVALYAELEE